MGIRKTANSRLAFTKIRVEGLPVPNKGRQYHYEGAKGSKGARTLFGKIGY